MHSFLHATAYFSITAALFLLGILDSRNFSAPQSIARMLLPKIYDSANEETNRSEIYKNIELVISKDPLSAEEKAKQDGIDDSSAEVISTPASPSSEADTVATKNRQWYGDPDGLSAAGSIGALVISVVAIFLSQQGASAQQIREKREELRGVIAQLVSLREEHSVAYKVTDEAEKAVTGVFRNVMRSVYLEAAESIARQIPKHVGAAEYHVLGAENYYDSDYVQSRTYYELAITRSKDSSLSKQSEIWRALASTYVLDDPQMRNATKAEESFEMAVELLKDRTDHYSNYTRAYAYRDWAQGEILLSNFDRASELLKKVQEEWNKIPLVAGFDMSYELRNIANAWRVLGERAFSSESCQSESTIELGRNAFEQALTLLQSITEKYGTNNDYLIDAKALVCQEWGRNETAIGSKDEGLKLLRQAQALYLSIASNYSWKAMRLQGLSEFLPSPDLSSTSVGTTSVPPFEATAAFTSTTDWMNSISSPLNSFIPVVSATEDIELTIPTQLDTPATSIENPEAVSSIHMQDVQQSDDISDMTSGNEQGTDSVPSS